MRAWIRRLLCFPHRFHGDRWLCLSGAVWLEQVCRCGKRRQTLTRLGVSGGAAQTARQRGGNGPWTAYSAPTHTDVWSRVIMR